MYGYIYKTTNKVNNKIYVGQHKAHKFMKRRYLGSGLLILAAIKKYGRANFICELLDTADTFEELNQKEMFWIAELKATDSDIGYNLAKGGQLDDRHTIIFEDERKTVSTLELPSYQALGWIDVRDIPEERRKQTDHAHYLANKEKYVEKAKEWHRQNKEKINEWQKANRERINAERRALYQADPAARARMLEKARKYREAHREELREKQRERRRLEKETKKR